MTDCIVVGGGLIGMLTARELAGAGASVSLLERGEAGRESSWAGGGILSPLYPWRYADPVTALARWSQARYEALARALAEESGIDPEWTPSGMLVLDTDEREAAFRWATYWQASLEDLDAAGVHGCEPVLRAGIDGGLWLPRVAQVRNPRVVKALKAALLGQGVSIREHTDVRGFVIREGRVTGVDTDAGRLEAGSVVLAGGAWSGQLLGRPPLKLEVAPVRGQMILFRGPPGLVRRIVLHRERYLIPRRDGRVLAGSTLEHVGFDKSTTDQALAELRAVAVELVPALADCEVEAHWAGLRPGSPAGVPYIGEHPGIRGLFVNTGHFRNGVVLGPASAHLVADLLLGRPPVLDPTPYRLDRPSGT